MQKLFFVKSKDKSFLKDKESRTCKKQQKFNKFIQDQPVDKKDEFLDFAPIRIKHFNKFKHLCKNLSFWSYFKPCKTKTKVDKLY